MESIALANIMAKSTLITPYYPPPCLFFRLKTFNIIVWCLPGTKINELNQKKLKYIIVTDNTTDLKKIWFFALKYRSMALIHKSISWLGLLVNGFGGLIFTKDWITIWGTFTPCCKVSERGITHDNIATLMWNSKLILIYQYYLWLMTTAH